jgi:hypothetical protein
LSNNKNYKNFKNIENFFQSEYNNTFINESKGNVEDEDERIETPTIELNHKIINKIRVGRFTKKDVASIARANRTYEDDYKIISNKKLRSSSFLTKYKYKSLENKVTIKKSNSKKTISSNLKPMINEIYTKKKLFHKNLNHDMVNNKKKHILEIKDLLKIKDMCEGNVFKITKKGKLKVYFMKLIKHDLFYYKTRDEKFHTGMHHLTNNIVLSKNKIYKYKAINLYSLSLINQGEKHSFYFDKEDQYNEWYKHFQKAISYRNIEDFYILGDKIKADQTKIVRDIYIKNLNEHHYHYVSDNNNKNDVKNKNYTVNHLLCTQLLKPSNHYIKQLNESIFNQVSAFQHGYHKHLCKMYDLFQDEKYLYIISEKCTGDNILQYLRALDIHNPYKEEEKICEIIHQLLEVVYYLHKIQKILYYLFLWHILFFPKLEI